LRERKQPAIRSKSKSVEARPVISDSFALLATGDIPNLQAARDFSIVEVRLREDIQLAAVAAERHFLNCPLPGDDESYSASFRGEVPEVNLINGRHRDEAGAAARVAARVGIVPPHASGLRNPGVSLENAMEPFARRQRGQRLAIGGERRVHDCKLFGVV